MLLFNNASGKVILLSLLTTILTVSADVIWAVLPFSGLLLVLYVLTVLLLTIWLTSVCFQSLLRQNKPFVYDFERNAYLKTLRQIYKLARANLVEAEACPRRVSEWYGSAGFTEVDAVPFKGPRDDGAKKGRSIDERIDDFVRDIEAHFVLRWYAHVSADETFLRETRGLLDDVTRRFLQVVVQIDSRKLVHGLLGVLLKHVKEFQKTAKRHRKNGGCFEDLYRYAHIGSKNEKAFEHFMCQMTTKIFRQFINWELYNSIPSKCLVSILARKLTAYMLVYASSPAMLNYKVAVLCGSAGKRKELRLDRYDTISISDVDLSLRDDSCQGTGTRSREKSNWAYFDSNTPKISPKRSTAARTEALATSGSQKSEAQPGKVVQKLEKKSEEQSTRVDSAHAVSEPVKIYESKSAERTWRNSSDLECVSLGQDLLVLQDINDPDTQIQDLIETKLWKDNVDAAESGERGGRNLNTTEVSPGSSVVEAKDATTASTPSPNIPSFLTSTIKPIGNVTASTIHNMKELQQSTVNNVVKPVSQATSNAMHKIGDLQDEAAGVMEGIFDLGMAGIRKGLRLTGLQDTERGKQDPFKRDVLKPSDARTQDKNVEPFVKCKKRPDEEKSEESKPADKIKRTGKIAKSPHVVSEDSRCEQNTDENVWLNPLMKDSPNFDGQLLLEKSPLVEGTSAPAVIPSISTEEASSPDPEYEDTTDLATTTAKLRSLLQQRSSHSNLTTPAVSPLPYDDSGKTMTTPVEYLGSSVEDITEVDGALPSLYKFCARTATGVIQNTLNTIKTALPGNTSEAYQNEFLRQQGSVENWTYVEADVGAEDLAVRVEKLLNERRVFCTVDNAYEAVETLDVLDHGDLGWNTPTRTFEDELDDFDVHVPLTKTLVDVFCVLVGDTNTLMTKESVIKCLLILFGSLSEDYIEKTSEKMIKNVNSVVGSLPNNSPKGPVAMKIQQLVDILLESVPGYVKKCVGEDTLNAASLLLLSSFQSHKINQDIALQVFELFSSLLIEASNKMSPTYSA